MEPHLARPLGLVALLLPALLLLTARRWRRPPSEVTGTLEVWREVASGEPPGGRHRRLPPALLFLIAALTLGALALAGPRGGARAGRSWHVVVDRSPSMDLPHADGGTRGERALAAAEAWLADARRPTDRVAWSAHAGASWAALDRAGVVWVTDRAPDPGPARAGLFASGGAAVPGPIAVGQGELLVWDGERIEVIPAPRRAVRVDRAVPELLAALVRVWAAARGLDVAAQAGPDVVLYVSGPARAARAELEARAGRDGWTAAGRVAGPADEGLEPWLTADGSALVAFGSGRVDVAWSRIDEPAGDPDAFAVSWSRLLDAALAPPPGVVPLEQRRDAGEPVSRPPREPVPMGAGVGRAAPGWIDALLVLLAAGCAALALRVPTLPPPRSSRSGA